MAEETEQVLSMLHRACDLLVAEQGCRAPDWARIIANANPDHLSEAVDIALEDDSWTGNDQAEEDEDGGDEFLNEW